MLPLLHHPAQVALDEALAASLMECVTYSIPAYSVVIKVIDTSSVSSDAGASVEAFSCCCNTIVGAIAIAVAAAVKATIGKRRC